MFRGFYSIIKAKIFFFSKCVQTMQKWLRQKKIKGTFTSSRFIIAEHDFDNSYTEMNELPESCKILKLWSWEWPGGNGDWKDPKAGLKELPLSLVSMQMNWGVGWRSMIGKCFQRDWVQTDFWRKSWVFTGAMIAGKLSHEKREQ